MKAGTEIKITKLLHRDDAKYEVGEWDTYKSGQSNDTSVPIDYTAEGVLLSDISIGHTLLLRRSSRNGVKVPGYMETGTVKKMVQEGVGLKVTTFNSVYLVEALK